jgi:hypothetical protein
MNSVTQVSTTSKSIAIPANDDPWAAHAATENGGQLGKLIKFTKGRWFQGEHEITLGTEFLALVRDAAIGDVRWAGGKPVEMRLGFIRDHARFADRASLDHLDKSTWETDTRGEPRDPWQQQRFLPMLHTETEELYCWAFSSHGARGAFSDLCRAYSPYRKTAKVPIISLQASSYKHNDYGRVDVPVLKVERWETYGDAPVETTKPRADDPISTGVITKSNADMNDHIPF